MGPFQLNFKPFRVFIFCNNVLQLKSNNNIYVCNWNIEKMKFFKCFVLCCCCFRICSNLERKEKKNRNLIKKIIQPVDLSHDHFIICKMTQNKYRKELYTKQSKTIRWFVVSETSVVIKRISRKIEIINKCLYFSFLLFVFFFLWNKKRNTLNSDDISKQKCKIKSLWNYCCCCCCYYKKFYLSGSWFRDCTSFNFIMLLSCCIVSYQTILFCVHLNSNSSQSWFICVF